MAGTKSSDRAGFLHQIRRSQLDDPRSALIAFEHSAFVPDQDGPSKNTLLFLGGLEDGLLTVPYTSNLAEELPPNWRLVEPILSSSYRQYGFSSLDGDVEEIADIVSYFDAMGSQVVLLGHSTGCQMIMHYLVSPSGAAASSEDRPAIAGAILQGPVSDREALPISMTPADIEAANKEARRLEASGQGDEVLKRSLTKKAYQETPITAKRWLSLASPGPDHNGMDDYFSSDLSDWRLNETFGQVGGHCESMLIVFGAEDQYVPRNIDKTRLIRRWTDSLKTGDCEPDPRSGTICKGTHTFKEGGDPERRLIELVKLFLFDTVQ